MSGNEVGVSAQFNHGASDHSDDPVTIHPGPALVRAAHVTESPSHDVGIDDGTTTTNVFIIPANTGVGTKIDYGDVQFRDKLIVNYDASATTGKVTLVWAHSTQGSAGAGS